MNKYGIQVKFTATHGQGATLAEVLLEAANLIRTAPGCRVYAISQAKDNPDIVAVTEVWDSKEDHDNSLSLEGVKELVGRAIPLLAAPPEKGAEQVVVGGVGLE